ncbi:hypothetical protein ABBQ32_006388 [Trebouxia sp. C0010 RCD-2024]
MQALRKRNQALHSAKQRIKGKLAEGVSTSAVRLVHTHLEIELHSLSCTYAAVRRHEQLAAEHQATVSEAQQLRTQNASLVDQVLSLTSQLNTEKVRCEQQLRAVRSKSKKASDLEQQQQFLEQQVQHLQQRLHSSQQQDAILRTELQHRCDKLAALTKDHSALLAKFTELTVLMSEAHNKLNTAVVQSSKAVATDHSKTVLRAFSHSSLATSLRNLRHKLPFSKDNSSHSCSSTVRQEATYGHHAAYHKAQHAPRASRLQPANHGVRDFSPLNPHRTPPSRMPPPCMPHQTPAEPMPGSPGAGGGTSPDIRPAFDYSSKKELKKATKVLLQRVADRDVPNGLSDSGWGPSQRGNSPFGALPGFSRNARPSFFAHTTCKPDWWPLKEWQDGHFLERADSGAIAAVHDAALVHILVSDG